MAEPSFLYPTPADVEARVQPLYMAGAVAINQQQWEGAFGAFDAAYKILVDAQPEDHRYHKGLPLHNMGLARLFGGDPRAGFRFTLLAFLEDSQSRAEEDPDHESELEMPAARNLVYAFSISGGAVVGLARRVRELVRQGRFFSQPEALATELGLEEMLAEEPLPAAPAKRVPGQFESVWDRRVFVGGSYQGQLAEINEIASTCRAAGFDAIVEFDFDIPRDQIHHHGLMLLHECRWAIFEVTTEAGQLMDLERTRDYQISPLVVHQGTMEHGRVSAMVETLLARLGLQVSKYSTMDELRHLVEDYLAKASGEAPGPSTGS